MPLSTLAKELEVDYQTLRELNPQLWASDFNIFEGQIISIPIGLHDTPGGGARLSRPSLNDHKLL